MIPLPTGLLLRAAPYLAVAAAFLGLLLYVAVLKTENNHLVAKIEEQAGRMGKLQSANDACAADVKVQNASVNSWLASAAATAKAQKDAIDAAMRRYGDLVNASKDLLNRAPPADPSKDCGAVEVIFNEEISRRKGATK